MPILDCRLGIDVGGTNTDAVILDTADRVLAKAKVACTPDITGGITEAIDAVLRAPSVDSSRITHVMLGTTHATNAVLERQKLRRVAVIRIGGPSTLAVRPMFGWPDDLAAAVCVDATIVGGGIEFDGRDLAPLDTDAIARFLGEVAEAAAPSKASRSPACSPRSRPGTSWRAAEIVQHELGDVHVSLSHEIGSVGLLERENATILNAALVGVARDVATAMESALAAHELRPVTFFAQNDGTLMALSHALRYPVLTIGSGPANSIRGAAFLTGTTDSLVADVGGTSTDVGVLVKGFPRESSQGVEIGGIRTNFRMPDLVTIALGGGTVVAGDPGDPVIGPRSVGFLLQEPGPGVRRPDPDADRLRRGQRAGADSAIPALIGRHQQPAAGRGAAGGRDAGRGDRPGEDGQGRPRPDRGRRRQHPRPGRPAGHQRGHPAGALRRGERGRRRDRLGERSGRPDLPHGRRRPEGCPRRGLRRGRAERGRRGRGPRHGADRRDRGDPAGLPDLAGGPDPGQGRGCTRRIAGGSGG